MCLSIGCTQPSPSAPVMSASSSSSSKKRRRGGERERGLLSVVEKIRAAATTTLGVLGLFSTAVAGPQASTPYDTILGRFFDAAKLEAAMRDAFNDIQHVVAHCAKTKTPVPKTHLRGAELLAKATKCGEEGEAASRQLRNYLFVMCKASSAIKPVFDRQSLVQKRYDSFSAANGPITTSIHDLCDDIADQVYAGQPPARSLFRSMSRSRRGQAYFVNSVAVWCEMARIQSWMLGICKAPSVGGSDMSPFCLVGARPDLLESALFEWMVLVARVGTPKYHSVRVRKGGTILGRNKRSVYYLFGGHSGVKLPKVLLVAKRDSGKMYLVNFADLSEALEREGVARLFAPPRLLSMFAYTYFVTAFDASKVEAFFYSFRRVVCDLLRVHTAYTMSGARLLQDEAVVWLVHVRDFCSGDPSAAASALVSWFEQDLDLVDCREDEQGASSSSPQ